MHGKFDNWIYCTGAVADDASRSLDAHLQENKDIKDKNIELLQMLTWNLEYSMLIPYMNLSYLVGYSCQSKNYNINFHFEHQEYSFSKMPI
jgi:hypothetical protein